MYPAPFEYHAPASLAEAVALLGAYPGDAKLLAGGHSLLPLMKLRFATPAHLVDLRRVPGLAGVRDDGGALVIGAMTTHTALAESALVRARLPILSEAAGQIGDALVRNAGTIGGSLAHADPGADLPAVMLALDAALRVIGAAGERTIAAADFFLGILASALAEDEVLTEIRVPVPPVRTGGAYEKHPHPASRYALVGVAAVVRLGDGDTIADARIALTGVGEKAVRAPAVERALIGEAPSAARLATAAEHANEGLEPRGDLQAPPEYRAQLAVVHTRRAIERAIARARVA